MLEAPRTSTYRTGGETTYRTEYRASEPGYRSGETSYRTSYVSGDSEPTYESYMRESGTTTGMKEGSSQARV